MRTETQRDDILKLQKRFRQAGQKTDPEAETAQSEGAVQKNQPEVREKATEFDPEKKTEPSHEDQGSELMEPEILDGGVNLEVSRNSMAAFLSKTD